MPELPPELIARFERHARERDGVAQQALWACEDGYQVMYTTSRVQGGPHDGKFLCVLYKPVGPGARTNPQSWAECYRREFTQRKAAKARAEALYEQHRKEKQ